MRFDTDIQLVYSTGKKDVFNNPTTQNKVVDTLCRVKANDSVVTHKATGEDLAYKAKVTLPYPMEQPSYVMLNGSKWKVTRNPFHQHISTLYLVEQYV